LLRAGVATRFTVDVPVDPQFWYSQRCEETLLPLLVAESHHDIPAGVSRQLRLLPKVSITSDEYCVLRMAGVPGKGEVSMEAESIILSIEPGIMQILQTSA
jgi:hypothetical protein